MSEEFEKAKKKLHYIKGFYNHVIIFIIMNLIFLGVALYIDLSINYFINFFVLPWGMGLFIQWMLVFKWNPFTSKDWEKRKIQEFIDKEDEYESNHH
ncbi:MAG: 2TM domain-containing protein [Nonlabens sp.]|uniref:2TM domain-containing protein n=1 Tax=Nonlabens sp. TaxID=1888209 RepID=UPI00321ABD3B